MILETAEKMVIAGATVGEPVVDKDEIEDWIRSRAEEEENDVEFTEEFGLHRIVASSAAEEGEKQTSSTERLELVVVVMEVSR